MPKIRPILLALLLLLAFPALAGEVAPYSPVSITIDHGAKSITVEPEVAPLWVQPSDDRLPTQLRWVVQCVETIDGLHVPMPCPGDRRVVVRPKKGCEGLFPATLEVPAWGNSMSSGPVDLERFEELAALKSTGLTCSGAVDDMVVEVPGRRDASWSYDVLVTDERGKVLFLVDPEIWIEKEGGG